MNASATEIQATSALDFFPVHVNSVDQCYLDLDLYLKTGLNNRFVLYCAAGKTFTENHRRRLRMKSIKYLYIPVKQHRIYRKMFSRRLQQLYDDPNKSRRERTRLVRASCKKIIEDFMAFPQHPTYIQAIGDIGRLFAGWSARKDSEFAYLLDMSDHDFYTVTHMVNVGVACGLLIREMRPDQIDTHSQFITAGLLHDVGKKGVPEHILNKEGKLQDREWAMIRNHPMRGYEILSAHSGVSDIVLEMTRGHHEKLDGTGYPDRLTGDQVGFAARLCAVVDVYDAIASARPYRDAKPPAEVLEFMRQAVGSHFDAELFSAWERVVLRLVEQDPDRAVQASDAKDSETISIDDLLPGCAGKFYRPATTASGRTPTVERRRHPRFPVNLTIKAEIMHHKGHPLPEAQGILELAVRNISQGGLVLITPWPLSKGDIVDIEMPGKNGPRPCRGLVNRIHKYDDHQWTAGLQFIRR